MCVLRDFPAIVVGRYFTLICCPCIFIGQTGCIIADGQHELVCNHPFVKQVESGAFRHFPDYHTGFPYRVWLLEHLPAAERVRCRLIGFYKFHRARLPSPGMVYQQLCIDAKQLIQHLLVPDGLPCDVSHRVDAVLLQFAGYAFSHTPEIRQRSVRPQLPAVCHLIQFRYAHTVLVRWDMLGLDVHCYFAEVQIGANPCGCRDASLPQYIADHSSCQFVCRDSVGGQIIRYVHEHFVY